MTKHAQTGTVPQSRACPGARQSRKKLPAARRAVRLAALAAPFLLLPASAAAASAAPGALPPAAGREAAAQTAGTTYNYAWYRAPASATSVSARFTVPKLACPARGMLGIRPGVELRNHFTGPAEASVAVFCRKGNPVYLARAILNQVRVDRLPVTVKAGDTMTVSASATATASSASIADLTQRSSVTAHANTGAKHLQAFVGDDALTNGNNFLVGVPPFRTITFRDAKVDGHALGASHPTAFNRVTFGVLQVRTGPLNSAGTSFTTTFKHT